MSILTSTDACAAKAGSGMVTTWALSGSTTAYAGTLSTDGYKLTATATWVNPLAPASTVAGETIASGANTVQGTCVETLTSAGAVQAATITDNGNFALCHFLFYQYGTGDVVIVNAQTGTGHWGSSNYLTATQWGTAGSGIIGTTVNSSGGTAITAAAWGMVLSPAAATTTTKIVAGSKTWTWYQPTYASTYSSTVLRRYGGGYNNSTADQVKGYCVSQRSMLIAVNVKTGIVAAAAKVTLSGASALAAGAVAFGVAALAI